MQNELRDEIDRLRAELKLVQSLHRVVLLERDQARLEVQWLHKVIGKNQQLIRDGVDREAALATAIAETLRDFSVLQEQSDEKAADSSGATTKQKRKR